MNPPAKALFVRKPDLQIEIVELAPGNTRGLVELTVRNRDNPSKKPPQNRGHLPNDLGVDAIPELLLADGASWITMNNEIVFIESRTAAKVAAIPPENQIEELFADRVPCVPGRFPRSAVDDYECGVGQEWMPRCLFAVHPEHIR